MSANTWENNVKVTLSANVAIGATSITVNAGSAPFKTPPAATTAARGYLTLLDDLSSPTKIETITYVTRTDNGDGTFTLGSVLKGQDGTADQSWSAGDWAVQSLTKGALGALAATSALANYATTDPTPNTNRIIGTGALPEGQSMATSNGNQGAFTARADNVGGTAGAAYIAFHRNGVYGAYLGIDDIDNKLKFGGWSLGANAHEIYHEGMTIPQETEQVPTLTNGWVNFAVGQEARYYKDKEGRVHLSGRIKDGTMGSPAFTLPAGYRPSGQRFFAVDSGTVYGRISVNSSGNVTSDTGSNAAISLDGISFRAA